MILSEIMNDPSRTIWAQSESSKNPNGFFRLMLLAGKKFKCRAHIWTDTKFGREAIHDHKCDFASRVLRGGYTNIVYRESEDVESKLLNVYRIDTNDPLRQTHPSGCTSMKVDGMMTFRERSSFVMPAHVLHSLENVLPYSMTLTTRGTVYHKQCRVFIPDEAPPSRPEIGLSLDEFSRIIMQMNIQYLCDSYS